MARTITTRVEGIEVRGVEQADGSWEVEILPWLDWTAKPFELRSTYACPTPATAMYAAMCDVMDYAEWKV